MHEISRVIVINFLFTMVICFRLIKFNNKIKAIFEILNSINYPIVNKN